MRFFFIVLCFSLITLSPAHGEQKSLANPRTMKFSELNFIIPKAERIILDCGIPLYLLRDTELPIINMTAMVKTGSVYEPAEKTGVAAITGRVMRSGGAYGITPELMDDELEFMASAVESSISGDAGTVSMTSLKKNFSRTLQLFSSVLLRPDFSEKRVEIALRQAVEGIRRQNDDPKEIADRELNRVIYSGHPLGNVATLNSVKSITRKDLVDFHRSFYRSDNIILSVSGDFDRDQLIKELNTTFKPDPKLPPLALPFIPEPKQQLTGEVLYAKKNVPQTVIRMGHLGLSKENPDIYAVRLLDYILGGGFTSRLMMEIRTNRGLAYNVGSRFNIGRRFAGSFIAETETKAESTVKAIELMKEIITGMRNNAVTDAELNNAKDYMINSFMFGFTNSASIVSQRARLEYYGYPEEFLENYRSNIAKVTKTDILMAARKYLHPDFFKIVVVGDAARFDLPLEKLGKARDIVLD